MCLSIVAGGINGTTNYNLQSLILQVIGKNIEVDDEAYMMMR